MQLKVLSHNIHKGFNWSKTRVTLEKLAFAIQEQNADIVFLQEIVGEDLRTSRFGKKLSVKSQLEYLAKAIGPHCAYAPNYQHSKGHHGNAIFSKYPIRNWSNHNISTNRLEQRGLLHCQIDIPHVKKDIQAFCSHLNLFSGRKAQHTKIENFILDKVKHNDAILLAGDFNDWDLKAQRVIEKKLQLVEVFKQQDGCYAKSFPAFFPLVSLDRIYYKNLSPIKSEILRATPWNLLSDHSALVSYFEFSPTSQIHD